MRLDFVKYLCTPGFWVVGITADGRRFDLSRNLPRATLEPDWSVGPPPPVSFGARVWVIPTRFLGKVDGIYQSKNSLGYSYEVGPHFHLKALDLIVLCD